MNYMQALLLAACSGMAACDKLLGCVATLMCRGSPGSPPPQLHSSAKLPSRLFSCRSPSFSQRPGLLSGWSSTPGQSLRLL
eukprot:1143957-Pelagomonas_calceolata.AAC.5